MNILALVTFTFVVAITPGPNNVLLWASGFNHGLKRTVPHIAGTWIGVVSVMMLMALGMGALFEEFPVVLDGVRLGGVIYLIYLAYRLATSSGADAAGERRPLSIREAVAFQYLNPKLWMMAVTAVGMSLSTEMPVFLGAVAVAAIVGFVILPCNLAWVSAGKGIGSLLGDARWRRVVNVALATLLVATVPLMLM